jgi:homoserine kinase
MRGIVLENMSEVTVEAPATVANVVCGFDCLGFALSEPFDEMTLRLIDEPVVRIVHTDDFGLPTEPERNVAGVPLLRMIEATGSRFGFELKVHKNIKPGSGIGSSSASACGAVVAANHLLGGKFDKTELVEFAMAGEALASGSRHADNLAPCIYGGFTVVRTTEPLDIVQLGAPPLFATVIHPQIEIKTSEARAMLPQSVPLKSAIRNWSNLAAFVAGLAQGDYDLLARSFEDEIVQPVRKSLIPRYDEVIAAGVDAGALGGGISGSGPSMFLLCKTREIAEASAAAVSTIYETTGIEHNVHVSDVAREGVRIKR